MCTTHAKRKALMPKDIQLHQRILSENGHHHCVMATHTMGFHTVDE